MYLAGCQINPIDFIFHLQKSLEIFDRNSAYKISFKKDKEWKESPLMTIWIKFYLFLRLSMQGVVKNCNFWVFKLIFF